MMKMATKEICLKKEQIELEKKIDNLGNLWEPLMGIGDIVGWQSSSLNC